MNKLSTSTILLFITTVGFAQGHHDICDEVPLHYATENEISCDSILFTQYYKNPYTCHLDSTFFLEVRSKQNRCGFKDSTSCAVIIGYGEANMKDIGQNMQAWIDNSWAGLCTDEKNPYFISVADNETSIVDHLRSSGDTNTDPGSGKIVYDNVIDTLTAGFQYLKNCGCKRFKVYGGLFLGETDAEEGSISGQTFLDSLKVWYNEQSEFLGVNFPLTVFEVHNPVGIPNTINEALNQFSDCYGQIFFDRINETWLDNDDVHIATSQRDNVVKLLVDNMCALECGDWSNSGEEPFVPSSCDGMIGDYHIGFDNHGLDTQRLSGPLLEIGEFTPGVVEFEDCLMPSANRGATLSTGQNVCIGGIKMADLKTAANWNINSFCGFVTLTQKNVDNPTIDAIYADWGLPSQQLFTVNEAINQSGGVLTPIGIKNALDSTGVLPACILNSGGTLAGITTGEEDCDDYIGGNWRYTISCDCTLANGNLPQNITIRVKQDSGDFALYLLKELTQ